MMMSSRQKRSIARPMRRSSRRRLNSQRRFFGSEFRKSSRTAVNGGACGSVSDKLKALKSLIPAAAAHNGEITKADQLFQETADYIVLLKTQVSILQRLVDFYGSSSSSTTSQNPNAV